MSTTSDILKCVQLIENIKPGEKLSIRNGMIEVDNNPNPVYRWFNGDNRYVTMSHLSNIVESALHIGLPIKSEGLRNLQETYKDSKAIKENLTNLIQKIDDNINARNYNNPTFFGGTVTCHVIDETQ